MYAPAFINTVMTDYFISISVPEPLASWIIRFQRRHAENTLPDLVEPHITVKNPDGLLEGRPWKEEVRSLCYSFHPIRIRLVSSGNLGRNVLYIKAESPDLMEFHMKLVSLFHQFSDKGGDDPEGENYSPHVSIAIGGIGVDASLMDIISEEAREYFAGDREFTAGSVRVMEIGDDGVYRTIEDIALGRIDTIQEIDQGDGQ